MQTQPALRLVKTDRREGDPIPFERRDQHRKPISGRVTVIESWGGAESPQNKIASLTLKDISDTGIGAISQEPIENDTRVTVFIPPHGPERGYDLYGRIVWCARGEDGYEVGIKLDQKMTACA